MPFLQYTYSNLGLQRDVIFASNRGEVSGLDGGQSYCFMVAAFIPSRAKAYQQGAWSIQQCTPGHTNAFQGTPRRLVSASAAAALPPSSHGELPFCL